MDISFKVTGDKEIAQKLLNKAVVQAEMEDAATKSAVAVHRRVSTYPKQRPHKAKDKQKPVSFKTASGRRVKFTAGGYVRTGTLGRKWGFKVRPYATFVDAFVENPTQYAPYVQDPTRQARVHQGRWPTTRMALAEMQQKIRGVYETALRNIQRTFGF